METLSDFGAVDHFAIQTFTTGIFRTWYGIYDLSSHATGILSLAYDRHSFSDRTER